MRSWLPTAGLALGLALTPAAFAAVSDAERAIAQSLELRNQGRLELAIEVLASASQAATSDAERARLSGELGAALFLAHRYDEAQDHLKRAYDTLSAAERTPYAIDLGNLALVRNRRDEARRYYEEGAVAQDVSVRIGAELDLARLAPDDARLALLTTLSGDIARMPAARERAFYGLNLGDQAAQLGPSGLALAYSQMTAAERLADQLGDDRLAVESRESLSRLYEDQHRDADALTLTEGALRRAERAAPGSVADLMILLDSREARLLKKAGRTDEALAAYRRAVDAIQAVRQDIPIAYEDGRSSFSSTLEPVYLGLADLLLTQAQNLPAKDQSAVLHSVKDVLELEKQAEMQDYLGDRCTVDALQAASITPPAGTAFLYPILLADRTELLLETPAGIVRGSVPVGQARIERVAREFAESLRSDAADYRPQARALYDWLIGPIDGTLRSQGIHTLVVVSDGVLRLIPIGALYDGQQFVVERFATATVTGLSMTNASPPPTERPAALIAGMSSPGPVVGRLRSFVISPADTGPVSQPPSRTALSTRGLSAFTASRGVSTPTDEAARAAQLDAERESLALPGVLEEVDTLTKTLHGAELLNADFTNERFHGEAGSGEYRIVHIASHGYFGGSAQDSFIMTYDELLTLSDLQTLLQSQDYRQTPIELLSLSACETAEGNERSPLGISGAAMKARAKSVLGTLWPVADEAARSVMEGFYTDLETGHYTKAEALRAAQLDLLHQSDTAHPFYWAPFILIGNWL